MARRLMLLRTDALNIHLKLNRTDIKPIHGAMPAAAYRNQLAGAASGISDTASIRSATLHDHAQNVTPCQTER